MPSESEQNKIANEQQSTPEKPNAQPTASKPLPKTDVDVRAIRTYHDDMAQIAQKESAISLSVKEAEKRQKQGKREISEKANSNVAKTALTFMSLFFLIGGVLVFGYFWLESRPVAEERVIIDTLILADKEIVESIEGKNRDEIISFVLEQKNLGLPVGEVTYINFTEEQLVGGQKAVGAQTFLQKLETEAPATLTRGMTGGQMFGLIGLENSIAPFWIVEVESFERAFGGVLNWETVIQYDIGPLFSSFDLATDPMFQDRISKNKDIRILYNDQGQEIMVHAFLDQNTLLFTSNQEAFEMILPLFISSKQVR